MQKIPMETWIVVVKTLTNATLEDIQNAVYHE